jgi:predicted lactoylglutathione lyase
VVRETEPIPTEKTSLVSKNRENKSDGGASNFKKLNATHYDEETTKQLKDWLELSQKHEEENVHPQARSASMTIEGLLDSATDSDFRGFKDAEGNLQSAASIVRGSDKIIVNYLSTAPWNLLEDDPRKTKYAGLTAMANIAQEAQEAGHGKIILEPLDTAVGFYSKLGFKQDLEEPTYWMLDNEGSQKLIDLAIQKGLFSAKDNNKESIPTNQQTKQQTNTKIKREQRPSDFKKLSIIKYDNTASKQLESWDKLADEHEATKAHPQSRPASTVSYSLKMLSKGSPNDFRGYKDADGNLQSAALVRSEGDALKVDFLGTAPWNHVDDPRKTKYAGLTAMAHIAQEAQEAGHGRIKLEPLYNSVGFYEKLGFKENPQDPNEWILEKTDSEKLINLAKQKGLL